MKMPDNHLILLANFYGTYINSHPYKTSVIVNNAGIEQLASLGVEKLKELKSRVNTKDRIYVLIVAGLTDILIKSVEQGKNKLEITPNSAQLIESKMQWAQTLLTTEGAVVIWAVMPPMSLRMYHQSEGWNIHKIPGMSAGLDKEQAQLNQLMLSYRTFCLKYNSPEARRVTSGPYFTDMVAELTSDRKTMNLNVNYFEKDGITPTKKLIESWNSQIEKMFSALKKPAISTDSRSSQPNEIWPQNPSKQADNDRDRGFKRSYSSGQTSATRDSGKDDKRRRESESDRRVKHKSPMKNIPSLLEMKPVPYNSAANVPNLSSSAKPAEPPVPLNQVAQLLAAVQFAGMSGNNQAMQAMMGLMLANQKKEEDEKRRREEDAAMKLRKQEEERLFAVQKKFEEERKREEEKRRVEENRVAAFAAQLLMEQKKREQEQLDAVQKQIMNAQLAMEQQAAVEMMAKTLQQHLQGANQPVIPNFNQPVNQKPRTALERINEKLRMDKQKRDLSLKDARPDPKIANDPEWRKPVVLFSFVNRNDQRKPLRGILGSKVPADAKTITVLHSRGQHVYRKLTGTSPVASFLKLKVRKPGELTNFERKVATYNNKLLELLLESEKLVAEGRQLNYLTLHCEIDEEKSSEPKAERPKVSPSKEKLTEKRSAEERRTADENKDLKKEVKNVPRRNERPPERRLARNRGTNDIGTKPSQSSATRADVKGKESSLPPADLPKPRWDKSDESEEELLWEDELDTIKPNDDDEVKSVASIKEEPAEELIVEEDVSKAKPPGDKEVKQSGGDGLSTVPRKAAPQSVVGNSGDDKKLSSKNSEPSSTEADGNGFLMIDEAADERLPDGNKDPTDGDNLDEDIIDGFVTIDETS